MAEEFKKVDLAEPLIKLIEEDEDNDLDILQRKLYKSMAIYFASDFKKNLSRTSLNLYGESNQFSPDLWSDFLHFPPIQKYLDKYRHEEMLQFANTAIISGDSIGLKLKKSLEGKGDMDNSNLILLRVPDKEDIDEQ